MTSAADQTRDQSQKTSELNDDSTGARVQRSMFRLTIAGGIATIALLLFYSSEHPVAPIALWGILASVTLTIAMKRKARQLRERNKERSTYSPALLTALLDHPPPYTKSQADDLRALTKSIVDDHESKGWALKDYE